jgi:uncharacterized repeat protein (TIGR03803 family)
MMIPRLVTHAIQYVAALFLLSSTAWTSAQVIEEVYAFEWPQGNPSGGLVEASDGNFYGVVDEGGPGGEGTIFRLTPSGDLTLLVAFDGFNGARPSPELVEGDDGNLYGTASVIFRLKLNGELTTIASYSPTNNLNPATSLTKGKDGNFYGTELSGGSNRMGTVFRITTNGMLTTLGEFNGTNGGFPECTLAEGEDGSLYGTTTYGGENGLGTVFRLRPAGAIETLMSFGGSNGEEPTSGLTKATGGSVYGMTSRGGSNDMGTIFRIDLTGECSPVASFGFDAGAPRGRLIQATDGNFYGAADSVFRFNTTNGIQPLTTIFNGPIYPGGTLLQGRDGFLYGAGSGGRGGIFRMDLAGNWTTIASFPDGATNGSRPHGGLVQKGGRFYGTTLDGGPLDAGTLFDFDPVARSLTIIPSGGGLLWHPKCTLLLAKDGSFYGTSSSPNDVFRVAPDKTVSGFASFSWMDAGRPEETLAEDDDGNLYGVTYWRGDHNQGTIFKVSPAGEINTLHSFNGTEGGNPSAGLLLASDGNLYGTTERGGPVGRSGVGTIFKVDPSENFTSLAFFSYTNGALPEAELIQGSDGNLYGTASTGGSHNEGTIFRVTSSGVLTSVFDFNWTNGSSPEARLVEVDGVLYGTTKSGGEYYRGVVFGITLQGELKTLVSFDRKNGMSPIAGLTRGVDGHLYGTTPKGGSLGGGNIYRLVLPAVQPTLRVVKSGEGITLTWPAAYSDFVLEVKADLNAAEPWRRIEEPTTTNPGSISISLALGGGRQFFRLVKR